MRPQPQSCLHNLALHGTYIMYRIQVIKQTLRTLKESVT